MFYIQVLNNDRDHETPLDNKTTLKVPGLHYLPINVLLSHDQFSTGVNDWYGHILTAKELVILDLINTITDRPDWHRAIFDQQVTAQWREDAVGSSSLINDKTWDWCLQELQDMARQFDRDGRLVVFNTSSGVCKSDAAISSDLKSQLSNFVDLLSHQAIRQKPASAVVNLVDPSLFPLVYGRTKILGGGQSCGMDDFLVVTYGRYIWSSKFQWLPCEVEFTGPPGSKDVRISSYINNLHPTNREMYSAIEAVISGSIKQWNEILLSSLNGRKKLPDKEDEGKLSVEEYEAMCAQVEAYLQEPESRDKVYWDQVKTQRIPEDWKARWGLLRTALTKYGCTFVFEHSDPGTAYSPDYELSKFFEANPWLTPYEWMYKPREEDPDDHQFYTLALQDEFRDQGLQTVLRIHSIELDPETLSFPGEEWHTKGNVNERIVANAIYALDSENMPEPQISFR
ncbi:hypothetical protein PENFLA_c014G04830 [Penicillium flavigenum]|uniref:Uncharacterized protein n=1 Tax=Penicillium flavigenum TaxID=254877 RepID=A0A1V6T6A7_9EURO|nr:hypothetical protein PENFLA_c014G04830 [Penicillium flavigenum]